MSTENSLRDYREAPFAYQDKPALRFIRQQYLDKKINARVFRAVRSLYVALTEISSDKQAQVITASDKTIKFYSGIEDARTIRAQLKKLAAWQLISIKNRRKADGTMAPRLITLLSVLSTGTENNQCTLSAYRHSNHSGFNAHILEDKGIKEINVLDIENISKVGNIKNQEKIEELKKAKEKLALKMSL